MVESDKVQNYFEEQAIVKEMFKKEIGMTAESISRQLHSVANFHPQLEGTIQMMVSGSIGDMLHHLITENLITMNS